MLIDIQAIRQAAKNKAAATGYTDNVDNVAAKNYPNYPRYPHYPVIHGVEVALTSPRHSPLLALADNYCSAIQASDKACNDWRGDIEATAPNDRQGLAAYLRGELAKLVPVAPAMPPKAVPTVPASTTWRQADRADQLHYWSCTQCRTGPKCPQGQHLHDAYIEVATRERFIGAQPDPAKPLPKLHSAQSWNVADRAYQAHHWNCTTCKAAARSGHSERCVQGQHLYATYEQAFEAAKGATP
ncbi:MAG: hypothetical protein K2Y10_08070 [Burkholderiaceae bacterium]|nr:hypothetical protein [Burkholderiaceae bacterium]